MKKISVGIVFTILSLVYSNSFAYSQCWNISVSKVESANGSGFHRMHEFGVVGTFVFVRLDKTKCNDSENKAFGSSLFLVLDDLDNSNTPNALKKTWVSMLMTAAAPGKTISFHATHLGINSNDMTALRPYYLALN